MSAIRPTYILRSHATTVNSLHFSHDKLYLASADADGFVVVWSLLTKRAVAVWQVDASSVLSVRFCRTSPATLAPAPSPPKPRDAGPASRSPASRPPADATASTGSAVCSLLTHSRNGKIYLWRVDLALGYSTQLPVDTDTTARKQPWIAGSAACYGGGFCGMGLHEWTDPRGEWRACTVVPGDEISTICIYEMPGGTLRGSIDKPDERVGKSGMVTALSVVGSGVEGEGAGGDGLDAVAIMAGYESGLTVLWERHAERWTVRYATVAHSEPVLSLEATSDRSAFFTVGADRKVVKHPLLGTLHETKEAPAEHVEGATGMHASQTIREAATDNPAQGLSVRSDGKIVATAGWDGFGYVYSAKTLKRLAVLQWHRDGCYASAFASVEGESEGARMAGTDDLSTETLARLTNTMAEARLRAVTRAHTLALGGKDGKISLWDIY